MASEAERLAAWCEECAREVVRVSAQLPDAEDVLGKYLAIAALLRAPAAPLPAPSAEEVFKAGWIVGLQKANLICYVRAHEWAAALEKPDKLLLNDDIRLEYEARKDEAFACRAAIETASNSPAPPAYAELAARLRTLARQTARTSSMIPTQDAIHAALTEAANALGDT